MYRHMYFNVQVNISISASSIHENQLANLQLQFFSCIIVELFHLKSNEINLASIYFLESLRYVSSSRNYNGYRNTPGPCTMVSSAKQ